MLFMLLDSRIGNRFECINERSERSEAPLFQRISRDLKKKPRSRSGKRGLAMSSLYEISL